MYYYIKNFIGGMLLVIGIVVMLEFEMGYWGIITMLPGWLVLFLGNKE